MLTDAMGLILADSNNISIGELTKPRALAAVPFAGRYRIIDFILSNMVNSGIINVGILTSNKYRSLMDHLGTGSAWDLSRKNKGLFILPPFVNSESYGCINPGDVDGLAGALDFFRLSSNKYIIVSGSTVIFNTTFNQMIESHESSGADITVLFNRDGKKDNGQCVILETDRQNWIKNIYINPLKKISTKQSLGVIVLRRDLLIDLITEAISRGESDLTIDVLIRKNTNLKLKAHEFKGVSLRINSIQSYFSATMKLQEESVMNELFMSEYKIFTKVKDEAPTLYSNECNVSSSLISDGCIIKGSIENSMLFRGVTISRRAKIKNSIIMQNVYISEGCELENVIIDKNSMLRPGIKLIGQENYPVVIGKGSVV